MMDDLDKDVRRHLLRKMHKMGCWGKHHISESNLPKGFPTHLHKKVIEIAYDLKKQGILVSFPTNHDRQWFLNPQKRQEIEEIIR